MVRAQDVMSAPAIAVRPDTTLKEIVQLLSARQISSVPVVDDDARVLGIIGWSELFPGTRFIKAPDVRAPVLFKRVVDVNNLTGSYKQAAELTAQDMMSPLSVCGDLDDRVETLVKIMVEEELHMIPILREDRLVGVVTRSDFIRYLAEEL